MTTNDRLWVDSCWWPSRGWILIFPDAWAYDHGDDTGVDQAVVARHCTTAPDPRHGSWPNPYTRPCLVKWQGNWWTPVTDRSSLSTRSIWQVGHLMHHTSVVLPVSCPGSASRY